MSSHNTPTKKGKGEYNHTREKGMEKRFDRNNSATRMTLLCNFMQRPFCVVEEALYKKYAFLLLFFPLVEGEKRHESLSLEDVSLSGGKDCVASGNLRAYGHSASSSGAVFETLCRAASIALWRERARYVCIYIKNK